MFGLILFVKGKGMIDTVAPFAYPICREHRQQNRNWARQSFSGDIRANFYLVLGRKFTVG